MTKFYWNSNVFLPEKFLSSLPWRILNLKRKIRVGFFYFKLKKANEIVRAWAKEHPSKWIYDDFYKEDRFISEIEDDENISLFKNTSEEIAEYAMDQLQESAAFSMLTKGGHW